jgi:hypothetical protein
MDPVMPYAPDQRRGVPAGIARRHRRREKSGQSTVEFALIVLPLFIIIFAIIDYAQIYFYENALQNAMREATRFATAGSVIQDMSNGIPQTELTNGVTVPEAIPDPNNPSREASRYECIRFFFQSNCVIYVPTNDIQVVSASALPGSPPVLATNAGIVTLMQDSSTAANDGPGNANDYVQVTATYSLHTITPLFSFLGGFTRGTNMNVYPVRVSAIVKNEPALLNFEKVAMYTNDAP